MAKWTTVAPVTTTAQVVVVSDDGRTGHANTRWVRGRVELFGPVVSLTRDLDPEGTEIAEPAASVIDANPEF